jgi:predicted MFS family arabinose efflux permease
MPEDPVKPTPAAVAPGAATTRAVRAFVFGNFVIGSGVLAVPGMLGQLAAGLRVSVPTAGQLIGLGALVMCVGAPLLAGLTSGIDRRRLLVASLGLYCAGHVGCALAPGYASLAALRVGTVVAAAVFTPQAAATIGAIAPPERRAAAVTSIFLGWSVASVAGMPMAGVIAARFGWQGSFLAVALLSAGAALWVARVVPAGVRVTALSLASWRSVLGDRRSRVVLAVTFASSASQFTLFSYVAPALRELTGQPATGVALLLALFGAFGIVGNAWISRRIGAIGPDRAVSRSLALMLAGLVAWALAGASPSLAWPALLAAIVLWGLGCFAANSAQQARLVALAPALASASIALNTSSLYAGQALGAGLGGALLRGLGLPPIAPVAAAIMGAALFLSAGVASRREPAAVAAAPPSGG